MQRDQVASVISEVGAELKDTRRKVQQMRDQLEDTLFENAELRQALATRDQDSLQIQHDCDDLQSENDFLRQSLAEKDQALKELNATLRRSAKSRPADVEATWLSVNSTLEEAHTELSTLQKKYRASKRKHATEKQALLAAFESERLKAVTQADADLSTLRAQHANELRAEVALRFSAEQELRQQLKTAQDEVAKLKATVAAQEQQLRSVHDTLQKVKTEHLAHDSLIAHARIVEKQHQQRLETLQEQLDIKTRDSQELRAQNSDLQRRTNEYSAHISDFQIGANQKQELIEQLRNTVEEQHHQLQANEAAISEHEARVHSLVETNKTLQRKVHQLEEELAEKKHSNETQSDENAQLSRQTKLLMQQLQQSYSAQIEELEAINREQENHIRTLSEEVALKNEHRDDLTRTLRDDLAQSERARSSAETALTHERQQLRITQDELAIVQQRLTRETTKCTQLQSDLTQARDTLSEASIRLDEQAATEARLRDELAASTDNVNQLMSQCEQLKADLDMIDAERHVASERVHDLEARVISSQESSSVQLSQWRVAEQELNAELEMLRENNKLLEAQTSTMSQKLANDQVTGAQRAVALAEAEALLETERLSRRRAELALREQLSSVSADEAERRRRMENERNELQISLDKLRAEYQQASSQLSHQLTQARDQHSELHGDVGRLQSELAAARVDLQRTQSELSATKSQLVECQRELQQSQRLVNSATTAADREVSELQMNHRVEIKQLSTQLRESEAECNILQNKLQSTRQSWEAQLSAQDEAATLRLSLPKLQAQVDVLRSENSELLSQSRQLLMCQNELAAAKDETARLQRLLHSSQDENVQLRAQLTSVQQTDRLHLSTSVNALERFRERDEHMLALLVAQTGSSPAVERNPSDQLMQLIRQLVEAYKQQRQDLDDTRLSLSDTINKLQASNMETETSSQRALMLQEALASCEADLKVAKEKLSTQSADLENSAGKQQEHERTVSANQRSYDALMTEYRELQREIALLQEYRGPVSADTEVQAYLMRMQAENARLLEDKEALMRQLDVIVKARQEANSALSVAQTESQLQQQQLETLKQEKEAFSPVRLIRSLDVSQRFDDLQKRHDVSITQMKRQLQQLLTDASINDKELGILRDTVHSTRREVMLLAANEHSSPVVTPSSRPPLRVAPVPLAM